MPDPTKPQIPELAKTLVEAMPSLEPDEGQLALALYRQLAAGEPVRPGALASELGRGQTEIAETLEGWPGVVRTDDGRVVSFWGLAISKTPHRFRVGRRQLFTWCAWDALFIPELIGRTAEVESHSPLNGEAVRVIVDPDGIREVAPETAVVSMLSPADAFDDRVTMSFCDFVHLFPSSDAGAEWVAEHPATFLLSVPEAHELGRIVNGTRFGAGLSSAGQPGKGSR